MPRQPTLETERLILRPFRMSDADTVQRLAGDRAVVDTTLDIPHPYEDGMAEKWISNHALWFERCEQVIFAVTLKNAPAPLASPEEQALLATQRWQTATATLIGAVGMRIRLDELRAELGYWIGRMYWNQGYCTEASRALLGFGFERLGLNRIYAYHFVRNPASGRVMQKLGMTREGLLRQHVRKWDAFEDLELYAILRSQWPAGQDGGPS